MLLDKLKITFTSIILLLCITIACHSLNNDNKSENSEVYSLEVTPDFVIINGSRNAGTFYGNSNIKKSCSG